jgi:hypothetical protein
MARLRLLVVGAMTFVAVHFVVVATWQTWFHAGDGYDPWFMNAASTVALTVVVFAAVNVCASLLDPNPRIEPRFVSAATITAGATVPMIVVLFTMRGGPGNLFPIVILTGAVIFFFSGAAGGCLGWAIRSAWSRWPPRHGMKTNSDS